jgi:hypothetical protein
MTTQSSRGYTRLALAIILASVLIAASLFLAINTTKTVTDTTTMTPTCPPPSSGTAPFCYSTVSVTTVNQTVTTTLTSSCDRSSGTGCIASTTPVNLTTSDGDWKFEMQLNSSVVPAEQEIGYTCYLTNISNRTQTIDLANPISDPSLYTQQGREAWSYEPPGVTNAIQAVPPGGVFSLELNIPTSGLQAGEAYTLTSSPNVSSDANPEVFFGQYLQLNATIQVVAG